MSNPVIEAGPQELRDLLRLGDLMTPFAIRVASNLKLPDHIDEDGVAVQTLAQRLNACPDALQRMIRLLAVAGVVAADDAGRVALTDVGRVLRSDHPLSMCDAYGLATPDVRAWSHLEHCMRTGQSGFERSYGESHRSYRAKNLEEDVRMDRAHQAATRLDILTLARSYPWQDVKNLVDVGGGTGTFLAGVLRRVPGLRGTLFDLPRMVANAARILAAAGVAERCDVVGGDFFNDVPAGAEVYVLKAVVGGWEDAAVVKMLSVVRRAMRPDSRMLLIEPVMGAGKEFRRSNVVQLHSFVLYGGRFRTVEDYVSLVQAADLQIRQVILRETLSIVELVPKAPG